MAQGIGSAVTTAVSYVPKPFWQNAAVEGVKAVNENAGNLLSVVFDVMEMEGPTFLANQSFTDNGHSGPSPNTARYFQNKAALKIGSSLVTNLADIGGVASGVQAASSSLAWYRINALFEKIVPASRRAKPAVYAHWYSYEVAKKAVPAGSLEVQMTRILRQKMYSAGGGLTKTAMTFGFGGLTGYFVNSAAAALQESLNGLFGQDTQTLAKGLEWFAFLETVVGRGGADGPARRILKILWLEFGLARASGVSMEEIVSEPCGWMVIADFIE